MWKLIQILLIGFNALTSLSSVASVYEPHVLWEKQELRVCFLSNELGISNTTFDDKYAIKLKQISTLEEMQIRYLLEDNFNHNDTGIHFTGWLNCIVDPEADIYFIPVESLSATEIIRSKKKIFAYGKANIGELGLRSKSVDGKYFYTLKSNDNQKNKKKAFVAINFGPFNYDEQKNIEYKELRNFVILHEFSHITGLRHENARPEISEDENCQQLKIKQEQIGLTAISDGAYDPTSIMNYCYLHGIKQKLIPLVRPQLNERDQKLLRDLYKDI